MCNKQKLERATTFKEGDKIWHPYYGNLIVFHNNGVSIRAEQLHEKKIINFTSFTKLYKGHYEKDSIEIYGVPLFENPFKQGSLVWVRESNECTWEVRYYSHYDNQRDVHCCYTLQQKSGSTGSWKQVRPFSQNPLV